MRLAAGVVLGWLVGSAACDGGANGADAASEAAPPDACAHELTVSPSTNDFGSVPVTQTSAPATITVTNPGSCATGPIAHVLSGESAADFSVSASTCGGQSLAPSASCTLTLVGHPVRVGAHTAELAVSDGVRSRSVMLLLSATTYDVFLVVSPSTKDFGSVVVGVTSAPQRFTVTAEGPMFGPLILTRSGSDPGEYVITHDECSGTTLTWGQTCVFDVAFRPTVPVASAAIVIVSSPQRSANVSLSGTGTP